MFLQPFITRVLNGVACAVVLLLLFHCQPKDTGGEPGADLIITNGKIATMEGDGVFAEAVAVRDGLVQAVGSNDEVLRLKGDSTQLIDAHGKLVIPGLNDSHLHIIRAGLNYNLELRWDGVRSLKDALRMLKEQAERTPEGQWVRVVGGWSEFQFEEQRLPTLAEINEAVPDKPVYILYLYSLGFVNQRGLEVLGYDATTRFPGGEITLGGDGKPTGLLVAKPSALVLYSTLTRLPVLSEAEQENSTLHYYRELNRLGITSAIDAGGGGQHFPEHYEVSRKLAREGRLTVRTSYYLFAQEKGKELDFFKEVTGGLKLRDDADMFKPNGYMLHGAGENLSWAAADFENFLEPRPELGEEMEQELTPIIETLAASQWPFRIHATYNESITRFLDIFEKVDQQYPFLNKVRWVIDHAETIDDANLQRIKEMGGGIAIQDRMLFQGEHFIRRYGREAALRTPPLRKMISLGIPVGFGTDGTRVSSYHPMLTLYWAVSGRTWGGEALYDESNRLSRFEALKMMTHGSAWFSQEEDVKGKIAPGYYADLVVLSDDYFTIPEEDIRGLHSLLTIVHGKVVYGADTYAKLAPALEPALPAWSPVNHYGGYQLP